MARYAAHFNGNNRKNSWKTIASRLGTKEPGKLLTRGLKMPWHQYTREPEPEELKISTQR